MTPFLLLSLFVPSEATVRLDGRDAPVASVTTFASATSKELNVEIRLKDGGWLSLGVPNRFLSNVPLRESTDVNRHDRGMLGGSLKLPQSISTTGFNAYGTLAKDAEWVRTSGAPYSGPGPGTGSADVVTGPAGASGSFKAVAYCTVRKNMSVKVATVRIDGEFSVAYRTPN